MYLELFFHEGLGVVAVPLFFVISGASFFRNYFPEDFGRKLKGRIKSLAIPYFTWNVIISAGYILIYVTPIKNLLGAKNEFLLTAEYLFEAIFLHKRIAAFWFIYNLMAFVILTPVFDFFLRNKWLTGVFALFLLMLPLFATVPMSRYGLWAIAPVYYFAGCIIGKYKFDWFSRFSRRFTVPCIVLCVFCVASLMCNAVGIIHIPVVFRQIVVIIYSLAFWKAMDIVCVRIGNHDCVNYNFIIYALHPFVQALLVKVLVRLLPRSGWAALAVYISAAILTIALIVLFGKTVKKISPRLYYLLSGGR